MVSENAVEKNEKYLAVLFDVLDSARQKKYAGWSKFDALNSDFLSRLAGKNQWLRLIFTQLIKMSPLNLRPFFGVKISRNPKGAALFARAYLFLYEATSDENYLNEAEDLLHWLIKNRCEHQEYFCWGYNYTWQDMPPFVQMKGEPIAIVTIFAGEAFWQAYLITKKKEYFEAARSCSMFLTKQLAVIHKTGKELAIAYTLNKENSAIINIQALTAAFLAKIWQETREDSLSDFSGRLINFVLVQKTAYDAWFYAYPSNKSRIRHDNYHTGGILDALLEYGQIAGDEKVMADYWRGLVYYKKNLFEDNGAPRWMNDRRFPHDVHGAAQGIISFTKAGCQKEEYKVFAEKIANWTIDNLYRPETDDFRYRQGRFFSWNYSLMHWCNGWMSRALAELVSLEK